MRRRDRRSSTPESVPPELLDQNHVVWHDQPRYHKYMRQRGWRMPPRERLDVPASPEDRRRAAAAAWAASTGVAARIWAPDGTPFPDWTRLREAGLC